MCANVVLNRQFPFFANEKSHAGLHASFESDILAVLLKCNESVLGKQGMGQLFSVKLKSDFPCMYDRGGGMCHLQRSTISEVFCLYEGLVIGLGLKFLGPSIRFDSVRFRKRKQNKRVVCMMGFRYSIIGNTTTELSQNCRRSTIENRLSRSGDSKPVL